MGKSNRERRAAKKRKAERRFSQHRSTYSDGLGRTGRPDFGWLVVATARAASGRREPPEDTWEVLRAAAIERGPSSTGMIVDEVFCDCLESVFEGGWQPAEVVRAVRRARGGDHADLSCTTVAAFHSNIHESPPRAWADQLTDLDADEPWWGRGRDWLGPWSLRRGISWVEALRAVVETLGVLMTLPVTESLLPPPSKWGMSDGNSRRSASPAEEAILIKVRALLAKAESTSFEHEADALTAKAQELMARHGIDEAVAESVGAKKRETPSARRIAVDDPYANPKSRLLGVIASANNVRAVWDDSHALMTLVGFEAELNTVDILFTSLLMQASKSMLAKGRIRDSRGHSRTRSFRQSFFVAFGQRIHERLVMAARLARETAERDLGRSLLPVLAGRKEAVDDFTARLFPHLTKAKTSSVTNPDGWLAGRAAAEMADLGPIQQRLDGTTG
jgi:hypothetical protein